MFIFYLLFPDHFPCSTMGKFRVSYDTDLPFTRSDPSPRERATKKKKNEIEFIPKALLTT